MALRLSIFVAEGIRGILGPAPTRQRRPQVRWRLVVRVFVVMMPLAREIERNVPLSGSLIVYKN